MFFCYINTRSELYSDYKQIVIAGTMEEISLSGLTATADSLVLSSGGRVTDEELTRQLYESLKGI